MKGTVLISGGSGLVGKRLTTFLQHHDYEVTHLSRVKNSRANVKVYTWDYKKEAIEEQALNCDFVIHLAGAPINKERWTYKRKLELISSRVDSSKFLVEKIKELKAPVKGYITSSGINLYEWNTDQVYTEESHGFDNFISKLVGYWEAAANELSDYCNVASVRTSIVLDKDGGALKKMADITKMNLGSGLGSGKQFMPWIHHKDLCGIYLHILENGLSGPFNAIADEQINSKEFARTLASVLDKKFFMPNVPEPFLRARFGRMAELMLKGVRASNDKIKSKGFEFEYTKLEQALREIYNKPNSL